MAERGRRHPEWRRGRPPVTVTRALTRACGPASSTSSISSRDAFVETDAGAVLTEWNRQAELLFGWSRDEVLGQPVTEFLDPDTLSRRRSARPRRGAAPRPRHGAHTAPGDAASCTAKATRSRCRAPPTSSGSGRDLRVGGFLHDRHEERAAEEAFAHAYLHDSLTGLPNRTLFTYRLAYAAGQGQGRPRLGGRARARPRPLQGHQRRAGPRGRRRGAGGRGRTPGGRRRHGRGGGPSGWRRVPRACSTVTTPKGEAESLRRAGSARPRGAPFGAGDSEVFITASIGIACTSARVTEATPLLSNADAAMYQAKKRGGGKRRGVRRGHAGAGARPHAHRALPAPGPRAQRAPALLPAGGGDQRAAGRSGSRRCCAGSTPSRDWWRPTGSSRWPRRAGSSSPSVRGCCTRPAGSCARGRLKRSAGPQGRGGGQPVGPPDRPPRDRGHRRAHPRRDGPAAANLTLEITESALMNDAASALARAARPQGPGRDAGHRRLRHGLLVAQLSAAFPARHLEDRQELRRRARRRPPREPRSSPP